MRQGVPCESGRMACVGMWRASSVLSSPSRRAAWASAGGEKFGGRAVLEDAPFVHEGDMVCQRGGGFVEWVTRTAGMFWTADALVGQAVRVWRGGCRG